MTNLFIIRVTNVTGETVHASIYAPTAKELQAKFDSWKTSANGRAYGNQRIVAYKYVDDKKVSERVMQG